MANRDKRNRDPQDNRERFRESDDVRGKNKKPWKKKGVPNPKRKFIDYDEPKGN